MVIDHVTIDAQRLPSGSFVSTITVAELDLGAATSRSVEREHRLERLEHVKASCDLLTFTAEAADRFLALTDLVVAAGRNPKPRWRDLMIAAVASVDNLPLCTRDTDGFRGLGALVSVKLV